jgi:ABC-2 type transport system permease protein
MKTLIRTELLKLRTTRTPVLLVGGGVALVVAGASGLLSRKDLSDPAITSDAAAHVGLTSLFALVLGILAVAGEYRHRTISDAYLVSPHRGRVLAAKAIVYAVAGAVLGVLAAVAALLTAVAWFAARGGSLDLSSAELWRTLAGGALWDVAFAIIGVGLGAVVRNLVGAIAGALAWLAVVEGVVGQLLGSGLSRWLPFAAGSSVGRLPSSTGDGLPQAGAVLVLAAYTCAFLLAAQLTIDRDVT